MREREVEDALTTLLGSRRRARTLLAATTLRHAAAALPEELETWMPRETARRFHAAIFLARQALSPKSKGVLDTPRAAYAHFHPFLAIRETERVVVAALDARFGVLATEIVAEGPPDMVEIRLAEVFTAAIRHRAVLLIAAHNHPSNEFVPSIDDYALTRCIAELGQVLGIRVLDHLVVTGSGFWSLVQDRGYDARSREQGDPYE